VDARSDIFSFGSVLYEMLTGKRAFEGRSGISTLSSILRDDVNPIYAAAPAVPPALEQIVQRCLSKEPAGRWQSMKEIEAALLALQRQLDPEGQFASPLPAVSLSVAVLPEPAFAEQGAAEWGESSPGMPVSLKSAASVGSASPVAPAPMNGPSKVTPAPVSSPLHPGAPYPSPLVSNPPASKRPGPPQSSPPGTTARQRPLAPQAAAPRRASRSFSETSPKLLTLALVLIGAVLVAGAGIGGWYWKTHLASSASAAIATSLPAAPTPPVPALALPVQETAPPAENPQAVERPPETVPPAPVKADDAAKSAKVKRTPKPKPDKTAKIIPPAPAPVAPPPPAPEPVAAPPAPEPAPEPKPVIQSTPVTVSDALPFLINLTEDVPADATEGQALHFTVGEDLHVGDKTVIAKGAMVTGEVVGEAGKKRFLGLGGHKLTFRLTQAQAVDGRRLAVRALAKNDGPPARPFGNIKGAKSKGYVARQGAMYVAYIDGDQIVAVRN
jgi:serine/threonine-protein kinase